MTARVLALAKGTTAAARLVDLAAARLAACVAIAITLWIFRPQEYPRSRMALFCTAKASIPARIVAVSDESNAGGDLELGGYVRVKASPGYRHDTSPAGRFMKSCCWTKGTSMPPWIKLPAARLMWSLVRVLFTPLTACLMSMWPTALTKATRSCRRS